MGIFIYISHLACVITLWCRPVCSEFQCPMIDPPDVSSYVNCKFEDGDVCLRHWVSRDVHGMRWQHDRQILNNKSQELLHNNEGSFFYLKGTDDRRKHGRWVDLISPPFHVQDGCLQFRYHHSVCLSRTGYVSTENVFKVMLRPVGSDGRTVGIDLTLTELKCAYVQTWYNESVSLNNINGMFKVVFSAKQHDNTSQSVAVDHVVYSAQSCSITDDVSYEIGDCDFEGSGACSYNNQVHTTYTKGELSWEVVREETLIKGSETRSRGKVLGIWGYGYGYSSGATHTDRFTILSPRVNITGQACLSLNYRSNRHTTDNSYRTSLTLSSVTDNVTSSLLYEFPTTFTEAWMTAFVPLPQGSYFLNFTADLRLPYNRLTNRQPHEHDDVTAIDDVEIHRTSCDIAKCEPVICDKMPCHAGRECIGRGRKHYVCG